MKMSFKKIIIKWKYNINKILLSNKNLIKINTIIILKKNINYINSMQIMNYKRLKH